MQRAYPAMAVELQNALGIKGFGFDMNVACSSATFGIQQVKRLWLHQANLSMNQLLSKRVLGREASKEEAPTILDEYANTSPPDQS